MSKRPKQERGMTDIIDHPATTRRHRWERERERKLFPPDTFSNCEETHRYCAFCNIVKVTVHPPSPELPYRVWIAGNGKRWAGDNTPECLGDKA